MRKNREEAAVFRTIFAVLFAALGRQSVTDAYISSDRFMVQMEEDRAKARRDDKADREEEMRSAEAERDQLRDRLRKEFEDQEGGQKP